MLYYNGITLFFLYMNDKETTECIQIGLEYLSSMILENAGMYKEYSEKDMVNAMIILEEVFIAKLFDDNRDKSSQKQLELLAKYAGKKLYELIKSFTGIDLHKAVKNI